MFYLDLFRCLHKHRVRYLLVLDAAFANAVIRDVGGVPVPLCGVNDMIALKQGTGRRQDADDIAHLQRLPGVNRNE